MLAVAIPHVLVGVCLVLITGSVVTATIRLLATHRELVSTLTAADGSTFAAPAHTEATHADEKTS